MAEITGHLSSSAVYQNLWIENICTARRVPSVPTCLYGAKVREAFLDGPFGDGAAPSQGGLSPRVGQVAHGRELSWCSASGEALRWAPLARGERMPPCRGPEDPKGAKGSGRLHHETGFGSQQQCSDASEKVILCFTDKALGTDKDSDTSCHDCPSPRLCGPQQGVQTIPSSV